MPPDRLVARAHQSAIFFAYFLGGSALLFSLIAGFMIYGGDSGLEIDIYGLKLNGTLGLIVAPPLTFCMGYVVTFLFYLVGNKALKNTNTKPGNNDS